MDVLRQFLGTTGFAAMEWGNFFMMAIGILLISTGIRYRLQPLFLLPLGFGLVAGNLPSLASMPLSVEDSGSVLSYLYYGITSGLYPSLLFLGVGATVDCKCLLAYPRLMLIGLVAQGALLLSVSLALVAGFPVLDSAAVGLAATGDAASTLFFAAMTDAPGLSAAGLAAYIILAFGPAFQRPLFRRLANSTDRKIKMPPPRHVRSLELKILPVAGILVTALLIPGALPLLGMFFFGNLLKESGVTNRLGNTARNALIDMILILMGFTIGAGAHAETILTVHGIGMLIFALGSFAIANVLGMLLLKGLNHFLRHPVNPTLAMAGFPIIPRGADEVEDLGKEADPDLHLHPSATSPNLSSLLGSALAAGLLWAVLQALSS